MNVQHFPKTAIGGGLTIANGVAYFAGLSAPGAGSIGDQTRAILKQYDELFEKHGLLKKNMLYLSAFMRNPDLEQECLGVYLEWMEADNSTAGYTVMGLPVQPEEGAVDVVLSLMVATDPNAEIQRIDGSPTGCRAAIYNGVAYFTGHIWPNGGDMRDHVAGALSRYQEQFNRLGMKKENVLFANAFVDNKDQIGDFLDAWHDFFGDEGPAAMFVQARPSHAGKFGDSLKVELVMFVAVGDDVKVERFEPEEGVGNNRVVIHQGLAYFTGHRARPGNPTLKDQTRALLDRYNELFQIYNLKKENLVCMFSYFNDISKYEDFATQYQAWLPEGKAPADISVQAPSMGVNELELQFIVAVD